MPQIVGPDGGTAANKIRGSSARAEPPVAVRETGPLGTWWVHGLVATPACVGGLAAGDAVFASSLPRD